MRVAVAGGTGVVGHHTVAAIRRRGHEAVVLSRRTGVDLTTGAGLGSELEGVQTIIDTTNVASTSRTRASSFFTGVAAHLQAAGSAAGVQRLLVLSIVGVDHVPLGYYQAKLRQEEAARAGAVPCTVVRATQFHEFPLQVASRLHVGRWRFVPANPVQPVAAASVGDVLADLALTPTGEDLVEIAGPRVEDLVAMARRLLDRAAMPGRVTGIRLPGAAGRAMRHGGLLPGTGARLVGPTFDEWLAGDDWRAVFDAASVG